MGTEPKHMPRTVGKGDTASGMRLTKEKVKYMSRTAGKLTVGSVRDTAPVELKHSNWRHKSKPDPKEVEYKKMMSQMGFANL